VIDFKAVDAAVAIAIETSESSEWLEVGVTSEVLSLSLDDDLLLGGSLEELLELVLGLNTNHFIFI